MLAARRQRPGDPSSPGTVHTHAVRSGPHGARSVLPKASALCLQLRHGPGGHESLTRLFSYEGGSRATSTLSWAQAGLPEEEEVAAPLCPRRALIGQLWALALACCVQCQARCPGCPMGEQDLALRLGLGWLVLLRWCPWAEWLCGQALGGFRGCSSVSASWLGLQTSAI